MNIRIGPTITALRREKGITQERLAGAVGVSAPAISKWETGQSYPDITLLPPLARFFGVTVDHLLAYEAQLSQEEREALALQTDAVFAREGWEAGLAHIRKRFAEHPTDMALRMLLAMGLMRNMVFSVDEAQREAGRRQQIEWLEQAADSAGGSTQLLSRYQLGLLYLNSRRLEEAEATFKPLEDLSLMNVHAIMPTLRLLQERYDEGIRLAQWNLFSAISDAVTSLSALHTLAIRQENYSAARQYQETALCLARDAGLEETLAVSLTQMRMRLAHACLDTDALLLATEQFADAATQSGSMPATPLFDRISRDGPTNVFSERDGALARMLLEDFATNDAYDAIRETPRFARLLRTLQAQLDGAPEAAKPAVD